MISIKSKSKDIEKKAIYKKRMSKLCPYCRTNYCYVGSRRCSQCFRKKKYYRVSSIASDRRYRSKVKARHAGLADEVSK